MDNNQLNKDFRKFLGLFIVIILLVAGAYITWKIYDYNRAPAALRQFEQALRDEQANNYQQMMADTYGGKTPQETLQMYIDAVSAGDYDLASKYFVEDKREAALENLKNTPLEKIPNVLEWLRESLAGEGSYSLDKTGFAVRKPVLVDFVLYPNGIWKITEI